MMKYHFNPLPPYGGRRVAGVLTRWNKRFQSTPSVWRETLSFVTNPFSLTISIHSLRMEGDNRYDSAVYKRELFQSTPSVWRETFTSYDNLHPITFQSTPSVWRETLVDIVRRLCYNNFNPLPPYGGRLQPRRWVGEREFISIHSLRMEGDFVFIFSLLQFNISIHSLRMEGDSKTAQESVFHFAYPCTILQKRMQKTTFCTRKNDFFRKKGEKFGAKPPASFCAPMIRTDIFPQTSLTESAALPCLWFPLHRYVPPSTDNDFPGNKTAGYLFLYQSPVPADA